MTESPELRCGVCLTPMKIEEIVEDPGRCPCGRRRVVRWGSAIFVHAEHCQSGPCTCGVRKVA